MAKKEVAINLTTLKKGTCKSVTGKSTLEYAVCSDPAGELYFRVINNSGGGNFSSEPVKWTDIEAALDAEPDGFSGLALSPLYVNRSQNNRSFLLAVLKALNLVQPVDGKQKIYEQLDPEPFLAEMRKLKQQDGPAKKVPAKKKAPRKKAAAQSG